MLTLIAEKRDKTSQTNNAQKVVVDMQVPTLGRCVTMLKDNVVHTVMPDTNVIRPSTPGHNCGATVLGTQSLAPFV